MTTNGQIQIIQSATQTIDENGDYIPGTQTIGKAIPALIYSARQSNRGSYEGDKYTDATYEVLIEGEKLSKDETTKVRLTDHKGNSLGDFTVQSFIYLTNTYRTKIIV